MVYTIAFLKALALTIILESIIAAALKFFYGRRLRITDPYVKFIPLIALASALTLPYVWFILPEFIKERTLYATVSEVSVTIIEAVFYYFVFRPGIKNALILSVSCNAFSFLVGTLIF